MEREPIPTAGAGRTRGRARRAAAALIAAAAAASAGAALAPAATATRAPGQPVDRSLFAPGACIAFAPSHGVARATVFLDAGHGGPDVGAVGVTLSGAPVHEADLTLRVALDALPLLADAGYRVVLSRTTAGAVARPLPGDLAGGGVFTGAGVHHDLIARDLCANRSNATILVGLYFNAATAAAAGSLTLYDADRPFWLASLRLAQDVQSRVLAALRAAHAPTPDDGVHNDVGYGSSQTSADQAYGHLLILGPAKPGYFSSPSRMPGALIEPLFITNPAEASLAANTRGQRAIAAGLRDAVEAYLGSR